jgi:hypothetical protein
LTEDETVKDMGGSYLLDTCRWDGSDIRPPEVAINAGSKTYGRTTIDTPIVSYGNFAFLHAPPKTMKTFAISLLGATYLADGTDFPNLVCNPLKGNRKGKRLAWFDTEQGSAHAARAFNRMFRMTNEGFRSETDLFFLRSIGYKERVEAIEHYLKTTENVGLVIIDGVADLISDVNSLEETNYIAQKFMTWTEEHQVAIVSCIHSNHGSSKPTGHLGSAMEKKTETQIELTRGKGSGSADNRPVFMSCKNSRNSGFDEIQLTINPDTALPEACISDIFS